MDKLKIDMPVIVEGKYDKIKLDSIIDARIITTKGFGVFSSPDCRDFIKKLAEKTKIIVLTDSDGAGLVIRNHIKSLIPSSRLIHLYTPDIKGKEKRKAAPSKAGTLGVEGMSPTLLRELFAPFASTQKEQTHTPVTKADLYEAGLLGGPESAQKRKALAKELSLPENLSSGALLDALNMMMYDKEILNHG